MNALEPRTEVVERLVVAASRALTTEVRKGGVTASELASAYFSMAYSCMLLSLEAGVDPNIFRTALGEMWAKLPSTGHASRMN